jgi:hypothetical protein
MPEKATLERARKQRERGGAPTTQAGEFIREEMHHIREGKHGARSSKQAIAIGLSKARRAGVHLGSPPKRVRAQTRKSAAYASRAARRGRKPSQRRARAVLGALRREGRHAASGLALSRQTRQAARRRGPQSRKAAARKAVATKGPAGRKAAARKAASARVAA